MINAEVRTRIESFWAQEFGCPLEMLSVPGTKVLVRAGSNGAFLFRYGDCCIWHVPKRFVPAVEERVKPQDDVDNVFREAFINILFGSAARLILGPCPIAYCNDGMLHLDQTLPLCRKLGKGDEAAVKDLATNCGKEAWNHGGVELEAHKAVFGCFVENQLVSAASYEIWGDTIAHVGAVTAPLYRGHGFAKSVATAATGDALREGLVPQWRTLASNVASINVGQAIGYEVVASHFFVRLSSG